MLFNLQDRTIINTEKIEIAYQEEKETKIILRFGQGVKYISKQDYDNLKEIANMQYNLLANKHSKAFKPTDDYIHIDTVREVINEILEEHKNVDRS